MPGPTENRITAAIADPETYTVRLTWRNGAETVAAFGHLVGKGVFGAFRDPAFFSQVRPGPDGYSLEWPDGLDFSADALWFKAHPEDNPFAGPESGRRRTGAL